MCFSLLDCPWGLSKVVLSWSLCKRFFYFNQSVWPLSINAFSRLSVFWVEMGNGKWAFAGVKFQKPFLLPRKLVPAIVEIWDNLIIQKRQLGLKATQSSRSRSQFIWVLQPFQNRCTQLWRIETMIRKQTYGLQLNKWKPSKCGLYTYAVLQPGYYFRLLAKRFFCESAGQPSTLVS